MNTSQLHDTHEIVIAATLWLMHRYQKTGCRKLAHMIEQHLAWMHDRATSPPPGRCLPPTVVRMARGLDCHAHAAHTPQPALIDKEPT